MVIEWYLSLLLIYVINHNPKQVVGRKGLISATAYRPSQTDPMAGTQDSNSEAGIEAETIHNLLPGLLMFCSAQFLIYPGPPAHGWHHHSRLGLLTTVINQGNVSTDLATR